MTVFYEVRVQDSTGQYQTSIANFVSESSSGGAALDYVLSVGRVGILTVTIPATFRPDLFTPDRLLDGRFGVWRSINGRAPALDGDAIYLARRFAYTNDATTITCLHVNSLFARRIIAYYAGSSYSSKAATNADNQIKTFVKENMGSSIVGADRDGAETQADLSALVSVAANLSLGASIAKAAARRNLLDVITELGQASTTAGTYLAAEIVSTGDTTLEARTYTGQRGIDRGQTSSVPFVLSEANGRLKNARLVIDHTNEVTFTIAAGQGEGVNRLIATQSDATRLATTPFNRIEKFVDMSNVNDSAQLQDEADAAVRAGRPTRTLTADLVETPSATRGIHYDLGDIVVMTFRNQSFDVRLDVIHEVVSASERRSDVQLRGVL